MLKTISLTLSGFCVILYSVLWYKGVEVQAWQALLWCAAVFLSDLEDYFGYA